MADETVPTYPNLPSFTARIISMALEKGLTTLAVAAAASGALSPASETAFVQIGVGLGLFGISVAVGFFKTQVQHKTAVALANAPAANPPVKA